MKRLAAMFSVCGLGSAALAFGLLGASGAAVHRSVDDTDTDAAADVGACVINFSKDGCDGYVEPGAYEVLSCFGSDCRTIRVTDAVYVTSMQSSRLACGGADAACLGKCDEFNDGTLTLKFNYIMRADSCCPYRGSWQGEWEYVTVAGRRFAGDAHGTLGVGTNRKSECNITDDACEDCYDVQVTDGQINVAIEGSFRGFQVLSTSPVRNELNFTMDGTWATSPRSDRPFGDVFRVVSRFDGDGVVYCRQ